MMDEQNQWASFFAGLFIGAGVALLLAPETGAQLRRRLGDYADDARKELEELADKGTATWENALEKGHEYAERGAEAVRDTIKSGQRYAEGGAPRARGNAQQPGRAVHQKG